LHHAGSGQVAAQLIAHDPTLIDVKDTHGNTALSVLVQKGKADVVAQILAHCPTILNSSQGLSVFKKMWNKETIADMVLAHKPELVHEVDENGENLLHFLLSRSESQEFITKVWRMNPSAAHIANSSGNTPFHLALWRKRAWAIKLMQWQLCFDDIKQACERTNTSLNRFRPAIEQLLEPLNRDVMGTVFEYLELETPLRSNKRPRDDEVEGEEGDEGDEEDEEEEEGK